MVKRKIVWSPRAKIDLFEILNYYYKRNGNKKYSQKINKKIRSAIRLLKKFPEIGVHTDVINVRNLIEGDYSIFYRIDSDLIEIIAIWDCRQDLDKLRIE
jgi:plasmid stabilization system protein ParE